MQLTALLQLEFNDDDRTEEKVKKQKKKSRKEKSRNKCNTMGRVLGDVTASI